MASSRTTRTARDIRTGDILDHFEGEPREVQREVLEEIQENWDRYDVFVVVAPTASGKSRIAKCIADWTRRTAILTPTNILVEQYARDFGPESGVARPLPVAQSKAAWRCGAEGDITRCGCESARRCRYRASLRAATSLTTTCTTYHLYAGMGPRGMYRENVLIDEAHNLLPFMQDLHGWQLWRHKSGYPANCDRATLHRWLLKHRRAVGKGAEKLLDDLLSSRPQYLLEHGKDWWRGGGYDLDGNRMTRGEPVALDVLRIRPLDVRDQPAVLWPGRKTRKVVLLSATIGRKDVEGLGLDRRRVLYLECRSPIPRGARPIIPDLRTSVNRRNTTSHEGVAEHVLELLERHPGEKGLIHMTYDLADKVRRYLGDRAGDRLLFHGQGNVRQVYSQFRRATPESGKVLVASGLYEGIDLAGDAGRWQAIAKVPWPSLGDSLISTLAEEDSEWYNWQVWKLLLQACGRICRTPDDFGVTYILDKTFERLYRESWYLAPEWWRESLPAEFRERYET